jgi:hypothetical protein
MHVLFSCLIIGWGVIVFLVDLDVVLVIVLVVDLVLLEKEIFKGNLQIYKISGQFPLSF